MFLKISQYSQEKICARVSFKVATLLKKRLWHRGFNVNFAIFLRTPFLQNIPASILEQFLALHLAIIYSWQHFSTDKVIVGEKSPYPIYLKYFTDLDFLFSFSLANACLPCQLCKAYAVLWAAICFVGSETPKHNDFDQF